MYGEDIMEYGIKTGEAGSACSASGNRQGCWTCGLSGG